MENKIFNYNGNNITMTIKDGNVYANATEMAKSFDGVDRVFAIQAGREIRIVVKPDKVDDLMSHKIARDIKTKIEEELTYPGHIKVTVIREVRASEVAK